MAHCPTQSVPRDTVQRWARRGPLKQAGGQEDKIPTQGEDTPSKGTIPPGRDMAPCMGTHLPQRDWSWARLRMT